KLQEVTHEFADADRGAVITGTGLEEDGHEGTEKADSVLNLILITGNIGKPGTGMNIFRGLNNQQGANDMGSRPHTLPGYLSVTDDEALEEVERVWGSKPPQEPGLSELEAIQEFGDTVQGAFVFGENPAVSKMSDDDVNRRFESLDFLVVQDIFETETTQYADVVLPGSAWAEKSGTVTNLDRQVQMMRPSSQPPGKAREDLSILTEIGGRLSNLNFDYDGPQEVFDEMTGVNPLYAGMSYEGIGDGGQRWPFPEGANKGVKILHKERFMTGRKRAPLRTVTGTDKEEKGDGLVLITERRASELNSSTVTGRSDIPNTTQERGVLHVNPQDAEERGIRESDTVVVEKEGSSIKTKVRITSGVRQGVVYLDPKTAESLAGEGRVQVRVP
ncbi:MAG: molybdopterin-dependent oxidoreductase, partial [Halobacteria archaeon]|nr:molybdopterin-dependent oxidoreductase [Halobacteria archaeon]